MTKAYSEDLRGRIIEDIKIGMSARSAARKYRVSASFAIKLAQRWRETGSFSAKRTGGYKRFILSSHKETVLRYVNDERDQTLGELRKRLGEAGILVSYGALWRFLDHENISYKKNGACRRTRTN